ncbi:XrtA/PEP-CTERM system amidotransferase [Sphingomonas sanguinis]|jgi:asparagine synthase (glutamine-hydrolysing)|uniref:asparagine synthase (glutamine-hydrolyzing) n=1 Tax=Sphingomonas sanguinis TaxID=33051 RepID=A0A7Y7QXV2_9SPHN|nr:XrtA/PEP-CTERM system amidotransferase [Sphingomonas sanguinis]MBZ6383428.1 amidotransferase 1, exosortase A system-associated [Sphingomonas sanguinis]NNG48728.1 amidotransferase 1, exosortase A system-associated [Sphingomonas sanguinis]NNG51973.1 amidotransferase 1, exosortase A system-associated [Sphingomonas sanguinis]NVP32724.1 amidotransferase 1, exosortase A system-associated [Sphingomonas sanguinis]
MCGIAGLFHPATPKPVDPARLRAMIAAQAHRGPDGQGVWTAPGVGFAHARLSIIDVAGSPQPMVDGEVAVCFNGEIYNYRELRAELAGKGAVFRTDGDTEVLLHGWRHWGPAMLDRLAGMFAFAVHDAKAGALFLARDRLGVKPLHWAELPDGAVAFASEMKGVLAHPLVRRRPDIRAVEDYLALGYVPDDASMVAGIRKLPAGHFLLIERGRGVPAPRRWWDVDFSNRETGSAARLGEELLARMREGVTSRMVADVPLGAFLSGGVDSSGVVALMAEASPRAVRTCTIGFEEAGHDERGYARTIAQHFATDHVERVVRADDFTLIDTLVAHFDEPFADASALATYRLCQLAREHVTVALSGDGADEAMAGYRRHVFHAGEERVRGLFPANLRSRVFGTLGRVYPKADWAPRPLRAKTTLLALGMDGAEAYARSVGVTDPDLRARLFTAEAKAALGGHRAEDRYVAAMRDAPARDAIDRAQYADLKIWLPGDILTKTDRISMAVGLEAREPLLDHRLVEYAARLPAAMRVRGGQGKWLMKKALEPYLPRDILYRPKMGFVTPISAWFRGALAEEAARLEHSGLLRETGWFQLAELGRIAADHRAGRAEHGRTLWQMLMLERSLTRLFL